MPGEALGKPESLEAMNNEQLFWEAYEPLGTGLLYELGYELDSRINTLTDELHRQATEADDDPSIDQIRERWALMDARDHTDNIYGIRTGYKRQGGCSMGAPVRIAYDHY